MWRKSSRTNKSQLESSNYVRLTSITQEQEWWARCVEISHHVCEISLAVHPCFPQVCVTPILPPCHFPSACFLSAPWITRPSSQWGKDEPRVLRNSVKFWIRDLTHTHNHVLHSPDLHLSLPSDHQGHVSTRWPPGDLQPGGGSGAGDQHAGAILHQTEPGGQLGVHPGRWEPWLRDDTLLHAQGARPERRRRATCIVHHRLRQRDRWEGEGVSVFVCVCLCKDLFQFYTLRVKTFFSKSCRKHWMLHSDI